jgi:hypothetical protein
VREPTEAWYSDTARQKLVDPQDSVLGKNGEVVVLAQVSPSWV